VFSSDDIEFMRSSQEAHMMDRCIIQTYSAGALNDHQEYDSPTYTDSAPWPCGLDSRPGRLTHGNDQTSIEWDATLRLPVTTPLQETDRIQIIERFGRPVDPITYEIAGPIQRGVSGIRIRLRKIVT